MGEVVNVLVAFAVIVLVFRWATAAPAAPDPAAAAARALGFRPRAVSPDMLATLQSAFPDISADALRYDLLRTGSAAASADRILTRGAPDPPPAYYTLYPRDAAPAAPANPAAPAPAPAAPRPNLLDRYGLRERAAAAPAPPAPGPAPGDKAAWEDSPAAREASLRERKAQMVLAARQRLLEREKAQAAGGPSAGP